MCPPRPNRILGHCARESRAPFQFGLCAPRRADQVDATNLRLKRPSAGHDINGYRTLWAFDRHGAEYALFVAAGKASRPPYTLLPERRRYANAAMTACRRAGFVGIRAQEKLGSRIQPVLKNGSLRLSPATSGASSADREFNSSIGTPIFTAMRAAAWSSARRVRIVEALRGRIRCPVRLFGIRVSLCRY